MKKTAAVFGAGIAGMSAAHELAEGGYEVTVYEYLSQPGGMARSYRYQNGLPSEYSWRGYGGFYKNVFHMMQRIPSPLRADLSVYDTELSRPIKFILVENDVVDPSDAENWSRHFTIRDWIALLAAYLRELASDQRTNYYATINAEKYFENVIGKRSLTNVRSIFGPWLGIDPKRTSLHHLANFFRMIMHPDLIQPYTHVDYSSSGGATSKPWTQGAGDKWLVLKRPTSESWFDPWVTYLQNTYGVKFVFNATLTSLEGTNGKIHECIVSTKEGLRVVRNDAYVIAINPFAVKTVVLNSNDEVRADSQLSLFEPLIQDGPHIQISFRIGYGEIMKAPEPYMAFILPDSAYNITMYFQNEIWYDDVFLGEDVRTLISGTACISYAPGVFGVEMRHVTKEGFEKEIMTQLRLCKNLNAIIEKANSGRDFNSFTPVIFEVWKDWNFSLGDVTLALPPQEMKWVNSTNTNAYMPSIRTSFSNMMLAGAHIKSSVDLYSMESACATGRDAAFAIINAGRKAFVVNKPLWARGLGKCDNVLYAFGACNILDFICVVFAAYLLFWGLTPSLKHK